MTFTYNWRILQSRERARMHVRLFRSICLSIILALPYVGLYSSQADAVSDDIVIAQVQTGGALSGSASAEIVLLYNNSLVDSDITNWCVEYSSAADNKSFEHCFTPPDSTTELWVSAYTYVSIATQSFLDTNPLFIADFVFSGGMAAGSGHLRLFDADGIEQDKIGWGDAVSPEGSAAVAHVSGDSMSRDVDQQIVDTDDNYTDFLSLPLMTDVMSGVYEKEIIIDLCVNIDDLQIELPDEYLSDTEGNCYKDFCLNIEGLQIIVPDGYEKLTELSECTSIPLENAILFITELLPNAPSVDTGQEFIELYNPNTTDISLKGYVIEVGPSFTKRFVFDSGVIASGAYKVFSDSETSLVLPNTNGVSLRLIAPDSTIVSESTVYPQAEDDVSWALIEDVWIWTNQITPGAANKPFLLPAVEEVLGVTTVLAPCPDGKYRSPDTNRCRNIESAVSLLQPCDEDEYRSTETNRCRKASTTSSSSSLTPCRSDQERNPATNRCRLIAASSSALQPCEEGKERNPETNRCRNVSSVLNLPGDDLPLVSDVAVASTSGSVNWGVITIVLFMTLGYMLYEWRVEFTRKFHYVRAQIQSR